MDATDTRARLIEVAVDLFTRNSFAGTSLQMIADDIGFTKAAIYHHFRTREHLLPRCSSRCWKSCRPWSTPPRRRHAGARADEMLTGYAELAVANRGLVGVLAADPSVAAALAERADWTPLITRQLSLLADVDPGPAGKVKAAMVFAGIWGASGPAGSPSATTNCCRTSLTQDGALWACVRRGARERPTEMKTAVVTGGGSGIGRAWRNDSGRRLSRRHDRSQRVSGRLRLHGRRDRSRTGGRRAGDPRHSWARCRFW